MPAQPRANAGQTKKPATTGRAKAKEETMTTQNEIATRTNGLLKDAGIDTFVTHLSYGEIAKKMEEAACSLEGFSEACYDQNHVNELVEALEGAADETDMENWNISADEWRSNIEQALLAKAFDEIHDDLIAAENDWYEAE